MYAYLTRKRNTSKHAKPAVPDVVVQVSAVRVGQPFHVLANGHAVPQVVVHASAVEGRERSKHGIVDHQAWIEPRPRGKRKHQAEGVEGGDTSADPRHPPY